ncbi:hypothetical protein HBB16_20385 [Pseudonocardia sp. MCCB 268]|nr:hypothetical protein [Pseudonocardia cytotoxica]
MSFRPRPERGSLPASRSGSCRSPGLAEADVAVSASVLGRHRLGLPGPAERRPRLVCQAAGGDAPALAWIVPLHQREPGGVLSEALMTRRIGPALLYGRSDPRSLSSWSSTNHRPRPGRCRRARPTRPSTRVSWRPGPLLPSFRCTRCAGRSTPRPRPVDHAVGRREVESSTTLPMRWRGPGATVLPASVAAGLLRTGSLRSVAWSTRDHPDHVAVLRRTSSSLRAGHCRPRAFPRNDRAVRPRTRARPAATTAPFRGTDIAISLSFIPNCF